LEGCVIWGGRKEVENKFLSISLAFTFMILVVSVASAGQEIKLTHDGIRLYSPAIDGSTVVWSGGIYESIFVRNLTTASEIDIGAQQGYDPAICGNKVVWSDNGGVHVYDISTAHRIQLSTGGHSPDVYGNNVVWQEGDSSTVINVYDLSTNESTQVTGNESSRYSPVIYGDKIVFLDGNTGSSNMYMYNISTHEVTQITASNSVLDKPAMCNDTVVWADERKGANKYADIYMYDLSTKNETQISTSGSAYFPAVYGSRIVWQDERNGKHDIYMYDLSTKNETQISTSGLAYSPDIYGDKIVWEDARAQTGNDPDRCDIYMYDLSAELTKPQASFTASVTSGSAPLKVLFTDTSTGGTPTKWRWNFGDGIYSKHAKTATHTFQKAGKYTVTLTATNDAGSSTVKRRCYITVSKQK
jgi:beta propeller repeat protein